MAPGGLHLGLDLQGGMHLVLKVDLDKAAQNSLELAANDLKDRLSEQSISIVQTKSEQPGTLTFTLPNTSAVDKINAIVKDDPDIKARIETKEGSFPRIFLTLSKSKINYIRTNAVNQSLEILRNRIDQFGVAEPVIIRQGDDEIVDPASRGQGSQTGNETARRYCPARIQNGGRHRGSQPAGAHRKGHQLMANGTTGRIRKNSTGPWKICCPRIPPSTSKRM